MANYMLQAGRGIVRDGVHIANVHAKGVMSPTDADELARRIVDLLNAAEAPASREESDAERRCPSHHWNRGDDVCDDCGSDLS